MRRDGDERPPRTPRRHPLRRGLGLAVLVGGLVAPASGVAAEETIAVPGTRVEFRDCRGFELSPTFAGVIHPETGASLLVSELPTPIAEMRASLTPENLKSGGLAVHDLESVTIGAYDATLVRASQLSGGEAYRKLLLVVGNERETVSLIGTLAATDEEAVGQVLLDCMLAARWHAQRERDPLEGLSFRVSPTERLVVSDRVSNMLFFTEPYDGRPPTLGDPLFIVGTSAAPGEIGDLAGFSRGNVQRIAEIKDVAFESEQPIRLDGLEGVEIVARAADFETGAPVVVYQAVAVGDGTVYMMQGLVGADRAATWLPEFRAVATSLSRAKPGP